MNNILITEKQDAIIIILEKARELIGINDYLDPTDYSDYATFSWALFPIGNQMTINGLSFEIEPKVFKKAARHLQSLGIFGKSLNSECTYFEAIPSSYGDILRKIDDYKKNGSSLEKIETRKVKNLKLSVSQEEANNKDKQSTGLSSIDLVVESLNPTDIIFLVLDKNFKNPIPCQVKNTAGKDTYIRKLFQVAYCANAPGMKVEYSEGLADSINNKLFRKRQIEKYMKAKKFEKPTLVMKSKGNGLMILRGEIPVGINTIERLPDMYRPYYIIKNR